MSRALRFVLPLLSTLIMLMRARYVALICLSTVMLSGCGGEPLAGVGTDAAAPTEAMPADHAGHAAHSNSQLLPSERVAEALATVVAVNPEGREITLDHGPLDGLGMGAMTMAFAVAETVNLGAVEPGLRVAIRVRQRQNYTYELTGLCETSEEVTTCLE